MDLTAMFEPTAEPAEVQRGARPVLAAGAEDRVAGVGDRVDEQAGADQPEVDAQATRGAGQQQEGATGTEQQGVESSEAEAKGHTR